MKRNSDDERILRLFLLRDERALSLAAESYGAYCYSVAYAILANDPDAQECVNDTWLKAWNAGLPADPDKLRPYLAQITRRLALDKLESFNTAKRGSGEAELVYNELSELIPDRSDTAGEAEAKALAESINRFLDSIPRLNADIFIRRCFFMEPIKDIARRYGMNPVRVSGILNRTREKLKKHLIREEFLYE